MTRAKDQVKVSVIIPFHNAASTLRNCLEAVFATRGDFFEVLLVDDHSSDKGPEIAAAFPARLIRMSRRSGPAAARNRGAQMAKGSILVFVDADVIVTPETVGALAESLKMGHEAVIGVYDEKARFPNFSSRFKNLWLCFMFQNAPGEVNWFWTGCGAIRTQAFHRLGGFNEALLCCEDYALGYALSRQGGVIRLSKSIKVKHRHLRSWVELLRSDFRRGRDNIRLLLAMGRSGDNSFATPGNALGVAAAYAALSCLALTPWFAAALAGWLFFTILFLGSNLRFLGFLARHGSHRLAVGATPLLYMVFLTMGAGAAIGTLSWTAAVIRGLTTRSTIGSKGLQG